MRMSWDLLAKSLKNHTWSLVGLYSVPAFKYKTGEVRIEPTAFHPKGQASMFNPLLSCLINGG